jgi:hypothetical protein
MVAVSNPNIIRDARAQIFDGLVDEDTLRAILGEDEKPISSRTLARYVARGLPYTQYGRDRWYPIEGAREWVLQHGRSRTPRTRGRPLAKSDSSARRRTEPAGRRQ